jgi:hypothetical protein
LKELPSAPLSNSCGVRSNPEEFKQQAFPQAAGNHHQPLKWVTWNSGQRAIRHSISTASTTYLGQRRADGVKIGVTPQKGQNAASNIIQAYPIGLSKAFPDDRHSALSADGLHVFAPPLRPLQPQGDLS